MGPDRQLDEYAARQFGVFSLDQARHVGLTGRMVERRVEGGGWIRLASGIYALASSPPGWERQLAAAVLSRPESLVAGSSAAHLHGFTGFRQGRPTVMVPIDGNARSPIARIIRSRHFQDMRTMRVRGFLTTSLAETIVALAGETDQARLEALVDDCIASDVLDPETLMLSVEARAGMRGIPVLRKLTQERLPDAYQPPATELERLLYRLLSDSSIPAITRQFPFPVEVVSMTVDAYIPDWRLIVEGDGRRWHTRKTDFERDRLRDNLATSHGVATLRFSYQMLARQPSQCLLTVLDTGRVRALAS